MRRKVKHGARIRCSPKEKDKRKQNTIKIAAWW